MYSRSFALVLLAALLLSPLTGCKKSAETAGGDSSSASPQKEVKSGTPLDTVARVHWLGIKRLAAETNAAYFMSIWNLPETAQLQAQTLDKLALWLAGGAITASNQDSAARSQESPNKREPPDTNGQPEVPSSDLSQIKNPIPSALRPLLDDLVNEESYLEIRAGTNQPAELALAIRLDNARAQLWETNLASAVASLTGTRPISLGGANPGWQLLIPAPGTQHPASSNQPPASSLQPLALSLQPFQNWTLLSLTSGSNSTLLADFRARIARVGSPFAASATNFWLEANLDLPRIANAFALNWKLPGNCPKTALTVIGDGQNVRTHARLDFAHPLPLELEPWNIPTNLIHDPLIGFTALRGFRPWLDSFKPWKDLHAEATPNQAYIWDQQGIPAEQFCAVPVANASNLVHKLSDGLIQVANPWIQAERLGQWQKSTNSDGVVWTGAPFVSPQIRSVTGAPGEFALAGLVALARTNEPAPPALFQQVSSRTNLLCYDWELTKDGLNHWLYLGQLCRFLAHKAQLPPDSVSFHWLKVVAPKLGNCVTLISAEGPSQLELVRKSSFGLASLEIHLLADWFESPKFPYGLHTFLVPPPPAPTVPPNTNTVPNVRK